MSEQNEPTGPARWSVSQELNRVNSV